MEGIRINKKITFVMILSLVLTSFISFGVSYADKLHLQESYSNLNKILYFKDELEEEYALESEKQIRNLIKNGVVMFINFGIVAVDAVVVLRLAFVKFMQYVGEI